MKQNFSGLCPPPKNFSRAHMFLGGTSFLGLGESTGAGNWSSNFLLDMLWFAN